MNKKNFEELSALFERHNFVSFIDHDGTLKNTNGVKDELLGTFCRGIFGGNRTDSEYNAIHREMHGRPMSEIFVKIAMDLHKLPITLKKGQEMSDKLNSFIEPTYLAKEVFEEVPEFYTFLRKSVKAQYVLTGMEVPIVTESLKVSGLDHLFDGVLGAPRTKEENLANIMDCTDAFIIGIGDAMSEYKEIKKYSCSIFIAVDFENRTKSVFPPEVVVCKSYDEVAKEIVRQAEALGF